MRKTLICLVVCLALVAPVAEAVTKSGSKCTKVGATSVVLGKKYICTKSGKKSIWKARITVITPKPTPSPENNSYPSDLSPVTLAAYKEFLKTYQERLTNEVPNIEFIIESNMDKVLEKQIVDNINATARFFANERPIDTPLKVWIAMSAQFKWIHENMTTALPVELLEGGWLDAKLARATAEPDGFMGGGAPGNDESGTAVLFFNGSSRAYWGDAFWAQVPAHEYTHVVQRYELGNSMAPMLCWVREGNANYYGFLMSGRNSQAMYRNFWLQALSRIPSLGEEPDFQSKTASYWADFFLQNESKKASQCDPWINYILGAMAFQYLGGTYGNDAIQNFYLGLKDAWIGVCPYPIGSDGLTCPSWKIVFKKSFGITPEEAYPKFGQYIADEIKWAKGKTVLWDRDASAIAPVPTN